MDGEQNIIAVIDDEEGILTSIRAGLENDMQKVYTFQNPQEGVEFIKNHNVDVVISDIRMSPIDGIEVLRNVKKIKPQIPVILLTAYSSKENADLAIREGAFDYLEKPYNLDHLRLLVKRGYELKKTLEENLQLKSSAKEESFYGIIGKSPQMQKIYQIISLVSKHDSTVLITGESGTGKELVAKCIHKLSNRKDKPFITINCGALPENLLESELFGHKKGAFTGAINEKKGLFEEANGGTIFLDEISTMPFPLQVKLLRVLQEREVRKVGDTKTIQIDVRVIAATNEDLSELVDSNLFRKDLYYRISVVPINIPPLKEREGDLLILINHFLNTGNDNEKKYEITPDAMQYLLDYEWPGNVRELENVIERLKILSPNGIITKEKLPDYILIKHKKKPSLTESKTYPHEIPLKEFIENQEKEYIETLLKKYNYDKKKVASILNITLMSLYRKIEKYKLKSRI